MNDKYPQNDCYGVPIYTTNWHEDNYLYFKITFIIFISSYIIYIITECLSPSFKYLLHKKDDQKMYEKMDRLFTGRPTVAFHCVCYYSF